MDNDHADPDRLLARRIAAEFDLHERTMLKALRGERSRQLFCAKRQEEAVQAYEKAIKAKKAKAESEEKDEK